MLNLYSQVCTLLYSGCKSHNLTITDPKKGEILVPLTEAITLKHQLATIVEGSTLLQVVGSELNTTMFVARSATFLEYVTIDSTTVVKGKDTQQMQQRAKQHRLTFKIPSTH